VVRSEYRYRVSPFALEQMQILIHGVCRAFEQTAVLTFGSTT
jgi:hypothetical protein